MKLLKSLVLIFVFSVAFTACKNEKQPEVKTIETEVTAEKTADDPNATYAKAEFTIKGMTCEMGCAKTIEKKLAKMDGVKSAKVDFSKELAMVEYNEAKVNPDALTKTVTAVADTYTVEGMKTMEASDEKKCGPDCKKDCCKDKKECKKDKKECKEGKKECKDKKKECKGKDKDSKKECAADCEKDCCKDKKEGKA